MKLNANYLTLIPNVKLQELIEVRYSLNIKRIANGVVKI